MPSARLSPVQFGTINTPCVAAFDTLHVDRSRPGNDRFFEDDPLIRHARLQVGTCNAGMNEAEHQKDSLYMLSPSHLVSIDGPHLLPPRASSASSLACN